MTNTFAVGDRVHHINYGPPYADGTVAEIDDAGRIFVSWPDVDPADDDHGYHASHLMPATAPWTSPWRVGDRVDHVHGDRVFVGGTVVEIDLDREGWRAGYYVRVASDYVDSDPEITVDGMTWWAPGQLVAAKS